MKKTVKPLESEICWEELMRYEDGELYWLYDRFKGPRAGDVVGFTPKSGHKRVLFGGHQYQTYRIIWILHNGPIPEGMWIDHKDRDPRNNKIENLRLSTRAQNVMNAIYKNRFGFRGVGYSKTSIKPWFAKITQNGKAVTIYGLTSPYEAALVHDAMAYKCSDGFHVLNFPEMYK